MEQPSSTRPHNRQHSTSYANMRCTFCSCLPPRHPTAYLTVRLHQHATHFRFCTNQTRSTVTVSLYLLGGIVGEKLRYYVTVSTRKGGGKLGSAISHLRPEPMKRAKQVLESFMRHSCQIKVPKYAPLYIASFLFTRKLIVISGTAEPASTAQQPDAGTSLSGEELRRERATCRPRPTRHLP
jgi:hypothetical protein